MAMRRRRLVLASLALVAGFVTTGQPATQGRNAGASVHLRPLTIPSPTGTDSVRFDVYGEGLRDVRQVQACLYVEPAGAFSYSRSSFIGYPGFVSLGITDGDTEGVILGSSALFASRPLTGSWRLGTFSLVPSETFDPNSWRIELREASIGPTLSERDVIQPTLLDAMGGGSDNRNAAVSVGPLRSPIPAPGEAAIVEVSGRGMTGVRQADVYIRVNPSSAFDYTRSDYSAASGLALLSLEQLSEGIVIGASTVTSGVLPSTATIGSFRLMPSRTFDASTTTVRLVAVSLGPSSYFRDIVLPENSAVVTFHSPEPLPEGPVSVDFNPAFGDQGQRMAGNAAPGRTYSLQLNAADAPEINGWSVTMQYDPGQVSYVAGSFEASGFIEGLIPLVADKVGQLEVGGTVLASEESGIGSGELGIVSFTVSEAFSGSTEIVITEVSYRLAAGGEDKRSVRFVATITSEQVASALPGDFNADGSVDFSDFFLFADNFGGSDPFYDLDSSGSVDFSDFFIFADNFGTEAQAKLIALAQQHIGLPTSRRLDQNFPNPFNSLTAIPYHLTVDGQVQVRIYDLTGQRLRTLVNGFRERGSHRVIWDGLDDSGSPVATGMYISGLSAGGELRTRKMLLVQ